MGSGALRTACAAALAGAILMAAPAQAAPADLADGVAMLKITVGGNLMTVRLTSPLHNLSGLRKAPRNDTQRQAIRTLAAKLRDVGGLLVPTEAAACVVAAVALDSPTIAPALLQAPAGPAAVPSGPGSSKAASATRVSDSARDAELGTARLSAVYLFRCDKPQLLTGLQVGLFDRFPSLVQVDAQITTGKGESGARLSPNRHVLTW